MALESVSLIAAIDFSNVLPEGMNGWVYYALCAVFFTLCGIFCGFFVWRKGHMQTLDAEMEVKRTEEDLKRMRDDLSLEENEICAEGGGDEINPVIEEVDIEEGEQADL